MPADLTSSRRPVLVSAVITTYDRPQFVMRAIRSVSAQTYRPLETIIVEDGSDSGVKALLEEERLHDVQYVCHDKNRGLAAARNTGLRLAQGEYVAYLDDDDEWKPERIEKQMKLLQQLTREEKARVGVVYCGVEIRVAGRSKVTIGPPKNIGNLRSAIIREGASTRPSTCLFPKRALETVGGYDEALRSSIDHDIWMALATKGYYAYAVNEPLVVTYSHNNRRAMTNTTAARVKGVTQYVEKWMPVYQEWFGKAAGTTQAQRYFARVIARLSAEKLLTGDFLEFGQAVRAIFGYSNQTAYNICVVSKTLLMSTTQRFLPHRFKNLLKLLLSFAFPNQGNAVGI